MKARPRVLWLHSHFELPTGGTKYIYEVARRMAQHVSVDVLVESASPLWHERYAATEARLHQIGGQTSTSLMYWGAFPAFLVRDARAIAHYVSSADAVISSFFPMPWLAGRTVSRSGVRHVSLCFEPFPFFHDSEVIGLYPPVKQALLRGLRHAYGWMDQRGVRSADALVTLNQSTKQQIAKVYGRQDAICAYAGVDTDLFRPYGPDDVAGLAQRFGRGPIVVHSTDFSPIKRTDLALKAFAVAAREVPDSRMVVTSTREDKPAQRDLQRQCHELGIESSVVFAGFLPFAELPKLYSLAAAVLQTGTSPGSGATTMSLPVKEALACGTPVVRSDATDEDVEDGVSGFLVDPRDTETTGRRLALLLADRDFGARLGQAGRVRVKRQYVWDRVVDTMLHAVGA